MQEAAEVAGIGILQGYQCKLPVQVMAQRRRWRHAVDGVGSCMGTISIHPGVTPPHFSILVLS